MNTRDYSTAASAQQDATVCSRGRGGRWRRAWRRSRLTGAPLSHKGRDGSGLRDRGRDASVGAHPLQGIGAEVVPGAANKKVTASRAAGARPITCTGTKRALGAGWAGGTSCRNGSVPEGDTCADIAQLLSRVARRYRSAEQWPDMPCLPAPLRAVSGLGRQSAVHGTLLT